MFFSVSFSVLQLVLITMFCFVFCTSNKSGSSLMDPLELETLFKIMETLSSDQDWRIAYPNPCQPGSSWPGIECKFTASDNHFHVTRLDVGTFPNPSCKNSANFPSEIFQLPYLQSIFIFRCFTQSPTEISFPTNRSITSPLMQLSLRSNSALVGTIPSSVSSLKSLEILTLSQNKLTGGIPVQIFSMTSLVHLDLSYNLLNGEIPIQVGNMINLVGLDLSYNKLTGMIPSSMGKLQNLQKLDMSSNSLNGTIPDTFHQLQSLVFLALSTNKLGGDFSRALMGLQNLQYFLMDDNPVFVDLPVVIGQLKKMQELRLSNSGYSGSIPSSYSELTNLSTLSLQNNRLCGRIPAGFVNLAHIYHLNLSRNLLDGAVPFNSSFINRLGRNLDLSGNPGLCLRQTNEGNADDIGVVTTCGSSKNSSEIKPLEQRSEASSLNRTVFVLTILVLLVQLVVNNMAWS